MAEQAISVPSVKGMKNALISGAIGAGGGILYLLTRGILGSGFLGTLAAIALAGSVIKGTRGEALATIAGFVLFAGLGGGSTASAASSTSSNTM